MIKKLFLILIYFNLSAQLSDLRSRLNNLENIYIKQNLVNLPNWQVKKNITVDGLAALAVSDTYLVTGTMYGKLQIWDLQANDLNLIATINEHTDRVGAIAISNDNKYIVSGSNDHTIKIYDINGAKTIATLKGHKAPVSAVAIDKDNSSIFSGSWDKTIKFWDIQTEQVLKSILTESLITSLALSKEYIIAGLNEPYVLIWTIFNVKFNKLSNIIREVAITNNGKFIVAGGPSTLYILKSKFLTNWEIHKTIEINIGRLNSLTITPDGKYAIISIYQRPRKSFVEFINLERGTIDKVLEISDDVDSGIKVSPKGKYLIVGLMDKVSVYERL